MLILALAFASSGFQAPSTIPGVEPPAPTVRKTAADLPWTADQHGARAMDSAHGWDLSVGVGGLCVRPTDAATQSDAPAWSFGIGTETFGRLGAARAITPGHPAARGERVDLDHGSLSEWFVRGEHGVEHGWTIPSAPEGDEHAPLWIGLRIVGDLSMHIVDDGSGAFLRDARGVLRLRYGYLHTFDANGVRIPSRISSSPWGVGIQIDAHSATFPIVVDPVIVSPHWEFESNQANVGDADILIDSAGDIDGDGYGDLLVAASAWNGPAGSDEGQVWVFRGTASGPEMIPSWIATGGSAGARFGHAACTAGDLNSDGYGDIAITSDVIGGGTVYVYYGGSSGLGAPGTPGNADFVFVMPQAGSLLNAVGSLAGVGDVDGDGYDDLALGARNETVSGFVNAGRIYVFFGGPAGIVLGPTNPWWSTPFLHTGTYFGDTLSGGDLNADGYADLMTDAELYSVPPGSATGRACVYYGGMSFRSDTTADVIIDPPVLQAASYFGSCRIVGDFTGDGFADAILGAAGYNGAVAGQGAFWLYPGSIGGISTTPTAFVESGEAGAYVGSYIATAGDIDGDGFADAFVSAFGGTKGPRLYYGGPPNTTLTTAHDQYLPNQLPGTRNGARVAGVGDVNGDGFCDVGHVAPYYSSGETHEGQVYVHFGSPNPLTSPQPGEVQQPLISPGAVQGGTTTSRFGRAVSSAGDVNADGFNDVIVGSPEFGASNNGRVQVFLGGANGPNFASPFWTFDSPNAGENFGWSVSAGDVDNDGKSDIVVGAPNYSNGQTNEGRLYLFQSLGTSIAASPTWAFEPNAAGMSLGHAVSALGDINADGCADIAVGAPDAFGGAGYVVLCYGRKANLSLMQNDFGLTPMVAGSHFGTSLAHVGDVNLDGFGDLAVGAPNISNPQVDEGRIYVYLGSYTGIDGTVVDDEESQQAGALLGSSIAQCGDINGDGRAEILVGAPGYDAATNGGAAFLYQAQPAGAGITLTALAVRAGAQANSQYGYAVSAGGDVNGDGWNDVLVGAPDYDGSLSNQGRIYLYLGSSSGLAASPSETYDGPSSNARLGESIALGGDVNGDGLSDPIGGVPSLNNDDGGVLPLYAGGNTACRVSTIQREVSDLHAVQILGSSGDINQFQINLGLQNAAGNTATAMGREHVRLEWEVQPVGTILDGSAIQEQASFVDSGSLGGGLRLNQNLTGLTNGTSYHWRARTVVRNPYYPHTRWTTIQLDGLQEKKLGLSADCNNNNVGDSIDIAMATSLDCDADAIPDECQVPPLGNTYADCNANLVPDPCEYDPLFDCDSNGILDECQIPPFGNEDCNMNSVVDSCDITGGFSLDTNGDGVPDECQQTLMAAAPFCFGDGTGTACPCGNTSPPGNQDGCLNSLGQAGRLRSTGIARVLAPFDNFKLIGTGMPNSSVLYFQGTAQQSSGNGAVFGDGKRCAAGSVVRIATKNNTGGGSQYPVGAELPISIKGLIPAGGGTRYYQCWYRNAASFCTISTFNLSNGFRVTWIP